MNQEQELQDQIYRFPHPNPEGRLCRPIEVVQKKIIRLRSSLSLQTPPSPSALKRNDYLENVAALLASNIAGQEGNKTYLECLNRPPPVVQPKWPFSDVKPVQDTELNRANQDIKKFNEHIQKMQRIGDRFKEDSKEDPVQRPKVTVGLFSYSPSGDAVFNLFSRTPQENNNLADPIKQSETKPSQSNTKIGVPVSTNASLFASKPPTGLFSNPDKVPILTPAISVGSQSNAFNPLSSPPNLFQPKTPSTQPNGTNNATPSLFGNIKTAPLSQIPSFFNPIPETPQKDEILEDEQEDQDDLDQSEPPQKKQMDFKDIKYTGVMKMFDNSPKEGKSLFSHPVTPAVGLIEAPPKHPIFSGLGTRDQTYQPSIFTGKPPTTTNLFPTTSFLKQPATTQIFNTPARESKATVAEPAVSSDWPLKVPQITSLQTNQVVIKQKHLFGTSPQSHTGQRSQISPSAIFGSGQLEYQKPQFKNPFGTPQTQLGLFSNTNNSGGLFGSLNNGGAQNIFSQAYKSQNQEAVNKQSMQVRPNTTEQGNAQDESGDDLPIASDQPEIVDGQMHVKYASEMEVLIKREANLYKKNEEQSQYYVVISIQKPFNGDKKYLIVRNKQTKVTIYTALMVAQTKIVIMSNKALAKIAPVLPVFSSPTEKLSFDSIRIKFNDLQSSQCFRKVLESGCKE